MELSISRVNPILFPSNDSYLDSIERCRIWHWNYSICVPTYSAAHLTRFLIRISEAELQKAWRSRIQRKVWDTLPKPVSREADCLQDDGLILHKTFVVWNGNSISEITSSSIHICIFVYTTVCFGIQSQQKTHELEAAQLDGKHQWDNNILLRLLPNALHSVDLWSQLEIHLWLLRY